jgi:hypothetical protein
MRRSLSFSLVTLGLATAMHLDWHMARPEHHHLSLGWSQHWLAAVPVFFLIAVYIYRVWPAHPLVASAALIGVAGFIAQVLEPLAELWVQKAPMEWAFGAPRIMAFAVFTVVGIVVHAATLAWLRRR